MKRTHSDLPRYTWDQAAILGLHPAAAFGTTLGLDPVNVRKWASRGKITRCGIGPNGAVLFHAEEVFRYAQTHARRVA